MIFILITQTYLIYCAGWQKITFRQKPFASLSLLAKLVGKASRRTMGTVKFRLDFNISRGSGERSGKLRLSFALPPLHLRSEGGKRAKQGRGHYIAVAELVKHLGRKMASRPLENPEI